MKLPHIIRKVYNEPWCITPAQHRSIQRVLEAHLAGEKAAVSIPTPEDPEDMIPEDYSSGGVRVIPIHGIIGKHMSALEMMCGGCSLDAVEAMVQDAKSDPLVTSVLFDVNSPGGTVTGVPELADQIEQLASEKPTIAYTDSECCSAAYWLASQCRGVYSSHSATIGSVGVYIALLDESRALENEGIKVNAIHAGKWKLAGAPFKPLTDEERAMFQAGVDKTHAQFISAVTRNRMISGDNLQGQCFDGEEAVAANLTDGIFSTFSEALAFTAALTTPKE